MFLVLLLIGPTYAQEADQNDIQLSFVQPQGKGMRFLDACAVDLKQFCVEVSKNHGMKPLMECVMNHRQKLSNECIKFLKAHRNSYERTVQGEDSHGTQVASDHGTLRGDNENLSDHGTDYQDEMGKKSNAHREDHKNRRQNNHSGHEALREVCKHDVMKFCGQAIGGGLKTVRHCMKAHWDELDEKCRHAIVEMKGHHGHPPEKRGHHGPPPEKRGHHGPPPEKRGHHGHPTEKRGHHGPPPEMRGHHGPPPEKRGHHGHPPEKRGHHGHPPEKRGHHGHPPEKRGHHGPPPEKRGHHGYPPEMRGHHGPPPEMRGHHGPPPDMRGHHGPPSDHRRNPYLQQVKQACQRDFSDLCPEINDVDCIREHMDDLSDACGDAIVASITHAMSLGKDRGVSGNEQDGGEYDQGYDQGYDQEINAPTSESLEWEDEYEYEFADSGESKQHQHRGRLRVTFFGLVAGTACVALIAGVIAVAVVVIRRLHQRRRREADASNGHVLLESDV